MALFLNKEGKPRIYAGTYIALKDVMNKKNNSKKQIRKKRQRRAAGVRVTNPANLMVLTHVEVQDRTSLFWPL